MNDLSILIRAKVSNDISELNKSIDSLSNNPNLQKLKIKIDIDSTELKSIVNSIQQVQSQINKSLNLNINTSGANSGLDKFTQKFTQVAGEAQKLTQEITEFTNKAGQTVKVIDDIDKETKTVAKSTQLITDNFKKAREEADKLANAMAKGRESGQVKSQLQDKKDELAQSKAINASLDENYRLQQKINQVKNNKDIKDEVEYRKYLTNLESQYASNYQKNLNSILGIKEREILTDKQRFDYEQMYTKLLGGESSEIQKQIALYKEQLAIRMQNAKTTYGTHYDSSTMSSLLSSADDLNINNFKEASKQIDLNFDKSITKSKELRKEATLAMRESDGFLTTISKDFGKMLAWSVVGTTLFGSLRQIQEATDYVVELDNALNEIRIVTGKSQEEVNGLAQSYNNLAKEMSVTTKEVASESANLFRQGLDQSQVEERMKAIIQYAKISKISLAESDKIITATANATGESVQKIIDIFALLGDTTSSDAQEIGESLQRVASAAENSNISLEKSASWLSTISSITRESSSTIGRSLNSVLSRYESIKKTGFNQEDSTKLNDVTQALTQVGIVATDSQGQLRNFAEVMDELGAKFNTLSKNEQAYISTTMFGTFQRNRGITLLKNYNDSLKNYENALNSTGTAQKKFDIYQESSNAKLDKFRAVWESLSSNTFNSGFLKGFIDFGTELLNIVDKLGLFQIAIAGLITYLVVFNRELSLSMVGGLKSVITGLIGLITNFKVTTAAIVTSTAAVTAFQAALTFGLSIAITAVIGLVTNAIQKHKEYTQELQTATKTIDDAKKSLAEFYATGDSGKLESAKVQVEALTDSIRKLKEETNYAKNLLKMEEIADQIEGLQSKKSNGTFTSEDSKQLTYLQIQYETLAKSIDGVTEKEKELDELRKKTDPNQVAKWQELNTAMANRYGILVKNDEVDKKQIKSLEELTKQVKETVNSVSDLNSIQSDLANGQKLTANSMVDLITKYPELLNYIHQTKDGFELEAGAIDIVKQALIDKQIKTLESESGINEIMRQKLAERLAMYEIDINGIDSVNKAREATNKVVGDYFSTNNSAAYGKDLIETGNALDSIARINALKNLLTSGLKSGGSGKSSGSSAMQTTANEALIAKERYEEFTQAINGTDAALEKIQAQQQLNDKSLKDQLPLMEKEIELYKQKQEQIHQLNDARRQERDELISFLSQKGFQFEGSGDTASLKNYNDVINNLTNQVNAHRNDKNKTIYNSLKDELKSVEEEAKRFFQLQLSELPKTSTEWFSLEKSINDVKDKIKDSITTLEKDLKDTKKQLEELDKAAHLQELQDSIKSSTLSLEPFSNALENLSDKMSLLSEQDISGRMDVVSDQFQSNKNYLSQLREEYDRFANTTPQTQEEADALAAHLQSLGENIKQAMINTVEYQKALNNLKLQQLSKPFEDMNNAIERELNLVSHNLKMLEGGLLSGTDVIFGDQIANYTVPQSAYERQRDENEKILNEQEDFQQKLQDIKEMQFEDEKRIQEEQREELRRHLEEVQAQLIEACQNQNDLASQSGTDINDTLENDYHSPALAAQDTFNQTVETSISDSWNRIIADTQNKAAQMVSIVNDAIESVENTNVEVPRPSVDTSSITSTAASIASAVSSIVTGGLNFYADGTKSHPGGLALVGDEKIGEVRPELGILPSGKMVLLGQNGAELVNLPKGTEVIPNYELKKFPRYADGTTGTVGISGSISELIKAIKENTKMSSDVAEALAKYRFDRESYNEDIQAKRQQVLSGTLPSNQAKQLTQEILDAIDVQLAKDIKMQSTIQEDLLRQQLENATNYRKALEDEYNANVDTSTDTDYLNNLTEKISEVQDLELSLTEKLKDAIGQAYEYEFGLMDKKLSKGQKNQEILNKDLQLTQLQDPKNYDKTLLINKNLLKIEEGQRDILISNIDELTKQRDLLEVGSYEWNLVNGQIEEYNSQLQDSNISIEQMNQNLLNINFDKLTSGLEAFTKSQENLDYELQLRQLLNPDDLSGASDIYDRMTQNTQEQVQYLEQALESLKEQLSLLDESSSDWSIINSQIASVVSQIHSANLALAQQAQSSFSNYMQSVRSGYSNPVAGSSSGGGSGSSNDDLITGLEKELEIKKILLYVNQEHLTLSKEQLAILNAQGAIKKSDLDMLQKELELQQLQIKLENLKKNKTVQTIKQQADGSYQYEYTTDLETINKTESEILDKQLEIIKAKDAAKDKSSGGSGGGGGGSSSSDDPMSRFDEVIKNAENRMYKSAEEYKKALEGLDLDLPIEEMVKKYWDYFLETATIYIKDALNTTKALLKADIDDFEKSGNESGASYAKGISDAITDIMNGSGDIVSKQKAIIDMLASKYTDFVLAGNQAGQEYIKGIMDSMSTPDYAYDFNNIATVISSKLTSNIQVYKDSGNNAAAALLQGLLTGIDKILADSSITDKTQAILAMFNETNKYGTLGQALGTEFMNGMTSVFSNLADELTGENGENALSQAINTITQMLDTKIATFAEKGDLQGVAYTEALKNKLAEAMKNANVTVVDILKILSESKDFDLAGLLSGESYTDSLTTELDKSSTEATESNSAIIDALNADVSKFGSAGAAQGEAYKNAIINAFQTAVDTARRLLDGLTSYASSQNVSINVGANANNSISIPNNVARADKGGMTPSWGSNGRLMFVDQNELVSDAIDTKNLIKAMDISENIMNMVGKVGLPNFKNFVSNKSQSVQNVYQISKLELPNVTNTSGVENLFDGLENAAKQHSYKK